MRPCECLGSVWSQRDRPGAAGIAPTVRATVTQFNMVTGCVLGSVLGDPGLAAPQRAQRLEKWIRIAQVLVGGEGTRDGGGGAEVLREAGGGCKAQEWGLGMERALGLEGAKGKA